MRGGELDGSTYEQLLQLQQEQLALIPALPHELAASLPPEIRSLVAENLVSGLISVAAKETEVGYEAAQLGTSGFESSGATEEEEVSIP